jgi:hypothetical protein
MSDIALEVRDLVKVIFIGWCDHQRSGSGIVSGKVW